jgi:hypothetical protein
MDELKAVPSTVDAPHLVNIVVGGKTPMVPTKELGDMGFSLVLYANVALQAATPRHNSCRLHRTKNPGAAMKDRSWHDTDKHSKTGRLHGCCRLKARHWNWYPGKLELHQEHCSAGEMMFSPCPPEGGHGLRRRACRL